MRYSKLKFDILFGKNNDIEYYNELMGIKEENTN